MTEGELRNMGSAEEMRRILNQREADCKQLQDQRHLQQQTGNTTLRDWCPAAWDDILCWDQAPPGTSVSRACPAYIPRFNPHEFAVRTCLADGTWEKHQNPAINRSWTNYTNCIAPIDSIDINYHAEQADRLTLMYTVGYSVSLASLVIAVFIMLYCRRLQCKSNTMHINLFLAFIMRASLAFLKDRLFVGHLGLPHDVTYDDNGRLEFVQEGLHWQCRLITVLFMFAISATQTWILMEGLYLYMLIHRTIITERLGVKPYMLLGWVTPWVIVIPWIIIKGLFENTFCWNMQENEGYFWILKGPWIAIVLVNFFFFLDIFRVLFMRVRSNHRHVGSSKYRNFAKFILVLIPLFGIMYIILFIAFPSQVDVGEYNIIQLYIEMGYNSFQGFILALLFCFLNEDVHSELRRLWRRHQSRRDDSKYITRSMAGSTFRHVSHEVSTTNSMPSPRTYHSSWKKREKKKRAVDQQPTTSTAGRAPSVGNMSSLGERHPLCVKQNASSLPHEDQSHDHSSVNSVSSESDSSKGARFEAEWTSSSGGSAVWLGRGIGNGTGGGVPAKIILLNTKNVEETSPTARN